MKGISGYEISAFTVLPPLGPSGSRIRMSAMRFPEMILFDYGQTLIHERGYDRAAGCRAMLSRAVRNPLSCTAEELAGYIVELEAEMERFYTADGCVTRCEFHNFPFQRYLLESKGIELDVSQEEAERLFWDAAAPGEATEGIGPFLDYLAGRGVRTGVISNLSFSGAALKARIDRLIPNHRFEFILATSEYVFRKPDSRIFQLALFKAGLQPEDVWYCGDSPVYDIRGAFEMGMQPVWYAGYLSPIWHTGGDPDVPHLRISSWKELQDILDGLA